MRTTLLLPVALLGALALGPGSASAAGCADLPDQAAAQASAGAVDPGGDGTCEPLTAGESPLAFTAVVPPSSLTGSGSSPAPASVMAASALAASTFTHYGPPNAAAWSLSGRSVSGGAGTLPNDYPAPTPWNLPAGDYCTAYKFAQPDAPTRSAPLTTVSDFNLGALTGFDPGVPREQYQLRHNAQADSSACQAKGATWGFWTNAATNNNYCSNWCGVRHDYSTGRAIGTRPWSNGYGSASKLVMSAFRHVRTYSGNLGWSYICAMLQDTTTSQRLEYCFRVWRSWSGAPSDAPIVFYNPQIGTGFTAIVTDLIAAGTRYGQSWAGGAATVLGTQPSGNTYTGAITRTHLVNAVSDTNAQVKAANFGMCSGLFSRIRCYSTDPDKYALLGVEDGLELLGSGASKFGGHSRALRVYTEY